MESILRHKMVSQRLERVTFVYAKVYPERMEIERNGGGTGVIRKYINRSKLFFYLSIHLYFLRSIIYTIFYFVSVLLSSFYL